MPQLFACVQTFREAKISTYAYTSRYELPPRTLTSSLREDILYVDEIIGTGEMAIADHKAPEPAADDLTKVVIDSYVARFLSKKASMTQIHINKKKKQLQTIHNITKIHEIQIKY